MSDVNVSIGVSLRELQQGLGEAGGMVRGFKEQASRARESAMFLANGISAIGDASKGASALAGNLLGGFAMGGPMGLAIGGVNALIQVFKDLREEEKKATEKALENAKKREEAYKAAASEAEKEYTAYRRAQFVQGGGKAEDFDLKEAEAKTNALTAARHKLDKATEAVAKREAYLATWFNGRALENALKNDEKLKELFIEVGRLEEEYQAQEALYQGRTGQARVAAQTKALEEAAKHAPVFGPGSPLGEAEWQMAEEARKAAEARAPVFGPGNTLGENEFKEAMERQKKLADEAKKAQDEMADSVRDTANAAASLGEAFGATFGAIATGQITVMQGLMQILNLIAQTIARTLIQGEVEAAVAAIKAGKSQADIPIVGPILAISAAAAVFAAMTGYLGKVGASAAGGFDIGNFNPVTQLHAKEMVLPAHLAERVRNMTEDGGASTAITINVSAIDAKGVEEWFDKNQGSLIKTLRNANRNGRA